MSKAEQIRALAGSGLEVGDIADRVGISYQHAYNVLKRCGLLPSGGLRGGAAISAVVLKPPLPVATLTAASFIHTGCFILRDGVLAIDRALPKDVGVYAFAKEGVCLYVGVATMGLARRLYFYPKPGPRQKTSQRINGLLRQELAIIPSIEIFTATPEDGEWRGLPVHGSAGLELGLIKKYALPWNIRSAK